MFISPPRAHCPANVHSGGTSLPKFLLSSHHIQRPFHHEASLFCLNIPQFSDQSSIASLITITLWILVLWSKGRAHTSYQIRTCLRLFVFRIPNYPSMVLQLSPIYEGPLHCEPPNTSRSPSPSFHSPQSLANCQPSALQDALSQHWPLGIFQRHDFCWRSEPTSFQRMIQYLHPRQLRICSHPREAESYIPNGTDH